MRFFADFYPRVWPRLGRSLIGAKFAPRSHQPFRRQRPKASYDFLISNVVKSNSPIWHGFNKSKRFPDRRAIAVSREVSYQEPPERAKPLASTI